MFDEKPLAIMVAACQEHGVISKMAELAPTTLDYSRGETGPQYPANPSPAWCPLQIAVHGCVPERHVRYWFAGKTTLPCASYRLMRILAR
jgi:hypothetical protein